MAGLIDPTKTGDYPVILGDGLLNKTSNEIFTGIRYNHKPTYSSPSAPSTARLKPSIPGQASSYDLSFTDNDNQYAFAGSRNIDKDQYVLYFDPARQAFILDRVDSTFNLNLTRIPGNTDPDALGRRYPHLDSEAKSSTSSSSKPLAAAKPARAKSPGRKKEPVRKPEKKPPQKKKEPLSLPVPTAKPKVEPKKQVPRKADLEEEDDDDDGDLLMEYPGGDPKPKATTYSPAFASVRRFDEFMDARESEADDADEESDGEPDDFKLPSPVNQNQQVPQQDPMDMDDEAEHDAESLNLEEDLEKDLEMAFEAEAGIQNNSNSGGDVEEGDESEISEED